MSTLRTATFTISIRGASEDELEAAAAAFVRTLHRNGLTPPDALAAWQRMDEWEEHDFSPEVEPSPAWWRTMRIARDAAVAALRAAGFDGQQRPFTIEAVSRLC